MYRRLGIPIPSRKGNIPYGMSGDGRFAATARLRRQREPRRRRHCNISSERPTGESKGVFAGTESSYSRRTPTGPHSRVPSDWNLLIDTRSIVLVVKCKISTRRRPRFLRFSRSGRHIPSGHSGIENIASGVRSWLLMPRSSFSGRTRE